MAAQPPEQLRAQLKRLGVDVQGLEEKGKLNIRDAYTIALGKESKERLSWGPSLKVADLSIRFSKIDRAGADLSGATMRIMDNMSA